MKHHKKARNGAIFILSGFWHEQSRTDRDKFIRVLTQNIKPGMGRNFDKLMPTQIDIMGTPYDACSVMHYGQSAFARVKA